MRRPPAQPFLIWHAYLCAWVFGSLAAAWFVPAACALAAIVFFDKRLRAPLPLCLVLAFFASAFAYTARRADAVNLVDYKAPAWTRARPRVCGSIERVREMPEQTLRIWLANVKPAGEKTPLPGLCLWTWASPAAKSPPLAGQKVCLSLTPLPARGHANWDAPDDAFALRAQGVYWRLWSKENMGNPRISGKPAYFARLRQKIKNGFTRLLAAENKREMSQASAMLLGLLFGDRFYLSRNTVNDFASAALAHSLALSGQHLSLAALIALLAVVGVARAWPGVYLIVHRTALIALTSLPFVFLYLWLGAAPPSLLRAACMAAILAIWLAMGKSFAGVDILCAALFIILCFNPLAIYDIGLQLSVLCLAILTVSAPAFARLRPPPTAEASPFRKFLQFCLNLLLVSLVIQLFLLPLTLTRFSMAGFWFPLNLIWLPLLGFAVLPFAALALVFTLVPHCAPLALLCARVAEKPCEFILFILNWLRDSGALSEPAFIRPHWTVLLAFAIVFFVLAWSLTRKKAAAAKTRNALIFALVLFAIGPALRLKDRLSSTTSIDVLDVSASAHTSILTFPGGGKILIDAAGSKVAPDLMAQRVIAPILTANREPAIDAVINVNPAKNKGLPFILTKFRVGSYFSSQEPSPSSPHAANHVRPRAGDKIYLGPKADNLWLEALRTDESDKEGGLALALFHNGRKLALFGGDLSNLPDSARDDNASGQNFKIVVTPRLTKDILDEINPETVILSGARFSDLDKNRDSESAKKETRLLNTGDNGGVRVIFDKNDEVKVKTARKGKSGGERNF